MEPSKPEIVFEIPAAIKVYSDGHVERLRGTDIIPPSTDPATGVTSKDIKIPTPESNNIASRLYLPKLNENPNKKTLLPLLIFYPGGAFCVDSPFSSMYHDFLNKLVAEGNIFAVSVDYRKAPEHPIPAAYEDSWAALKWVASHCNGDGPEPWLNHHADFERVFLSGISAGANVAHNMAMLAGDSENGLGIKLLGVALQHPYFWGSDPIGSEAVDPDWKAFMDRHWQFLCPSNPDVDDPRLNPAVGGGSGLAGLVCERVLVCVAEKDALKDRGWLYYETLARSGWTGVVEILETEGKDHGFHMYDLECKETQDLIRRLASFFNR